MGLRFRKSINICKGVRLNVGTKGLSVSLGTKGLHHTIHTSGRMTSTIGLPGTGLSYVKTSSWKKKKKTENRKRISEETGQAKSTEMEKNERLVEEFNEMLEEIRSLHEEATAPIDWNEVKNAPSPKKEEDSLFSRFFEAAEQQDSQQEDESILQWKADRELAERILQGDIDAYFEAVEAIQPFEKILDYGSDFELGTDIPDVIEVEFHARTSRVVPDRTLSLTPTGKLSTKAMTKTLHYDIAQDYICSCVLRVAREMFAILPVKQVLVHVEDEVDGKNETVLSVLFDRRHFEELDLENLDPSEALQEFECHMDFKKTQGLKPVERVDLI